MAGLFHSLNIGAQSLFVTRQGIDSTAHNIANAQTEGYSRQRVEATQRDPSLSHGVLIGNGVYTETIKRAHDDFMEKQITLANSSFGETKSRHASMLNLEAIYSNELNSSIAQEISSFFDSLQTLSSFPEELTVRTSVLERGKNVAAAFRHVDTELRKYRSGNNEEVKALTTQLSDMIHNIASLNQQIREVETSPDIHANDLRDKRDKVVRQLSGKLDIQYYEDQFGMLTIRGPNESLLVDRGRSATFSVQRNDKNSGMYNILVSDFEGHRDQDITAKVRGGSLGALIDVRDNIVPSYMEHTNDLAYTFGNKFNEIHQMGFGLRDYRLSSGRNFFADVEDKASAAQNISVDTSIINSIDAIAAGSTPNTAGDNVNVNRLLDLKDQKVMEQGNATFVESYSNFVGRIGIEALRADHLAESAKILITDLTARGDSVSGVSLDEEATNMLRWQKAFTASSKVITTVDEMLDTLLNIKR